MPNAGNERKRDLHFATGIVTKCFGIYMNLF